MPYNQNIYQPHPSDPRNIKITNVVMSLPSLYEKLRLDEVAYGRKVDYYWGFDKMSRLIEAILLRIPLPVFYFDVSNPYKWVLIDGIERIDAMDAFMSNEFKLYNMEILKHLNGSNYEMLGANYKRILYDTQIITYQVEAQTPPHLRELIFKKIRDMNAN